MRRYKHKKDPYQSAEQFQTIQRADGRTPFLLNEAREKKTVNTWEEKRAEKNRKQKSDQVKIVREQVAEQIAQRKGQSKMRKKKDG